MIFSELSNNELEESLERYDDLYAEALNKFDLGAMDAILKLWEQAEKEAIKRGLIESVDA